MLRGHPGVEVTAPLSVTEFGFSLHAATHAGAEDARGREALCKYVLRPPLAQERLCLLPDGLVRITLRKPFRDGTYAIDMDPLSLLCRLATTIPPPRMHVVHYAGVLAPAAKLRPLIVPPPPPSPEGDAAKPKDKLPTHRCAYIPWAILAKKTFKEDIDICPKCGGKMKLKSLVQKPENIARFLRHLGEPTEPPPLAVPSGPRACPPCPCPTRLRRARRRREPRRTGRFASCAASPRRRPKCSTPSLAACQDAAGLVLCQPACFMRCAAIHSGRNTVYRAFSSARFCLPTRADRPRIGPSNPVFALDALFLSLTRQRGPGPARGHRGAGGRPCPPMPGAYRACRDRRRRSHDRLPCAHWTVRFGWGKAATRWRGGRFEGRELSIALEAAGCSGTG